MPCGRIGVTFVYNFALRKFDFRGRWSATPKNRGLSKKTQGRRALKNGGGSLAVGSYLQRSSAPPPPGNWRSYIDEWASRTIGGEEAGGDQGV